MRTLFAMPTRPTKDDDKKALNNKTRRTAGPVISGGGNSISSRLATAKMLSEKLLGHLKDSLDCYVAEEQLTNLIDKAIENGELSLDTEVDSLDRIDGKIAGVCLYTPGMNAAYVPCGHISHMTHVLLQGQLSVEFIKSELCRAKEAGVKFIFHNAKFDMHIVYWMIGTKLIPYWDTYIGGNLLNENESHNLKYLWNKYCNDAEETQELAKFNTLFDGIPFNMVPIEIAYLYAANDAKMTYELYQFQKQFLDITSPLCRQRGLEKVAKLFREIEMPLIEVVWDMEATGIKLDLDYANELKDKYSKLLDTAQTKAYEEISKVQYLIDQLAVNKPQLYKKLSNPINLSSPTQLAILFYDVMEFKSSDPKSPRGTGEEILKAINHPICEAILEYRGIVKLMSTYIEAIPSQVSKQTGRLHASFNQYGAKTGRFSSSDPNLQNIPSKNTDIRKMFVANEGCVLLSSDYSQQEPRCLAHMSGDENMTKAYIEGKDIYAIIASTLYGVPYEQCLEFDEHGHKNPEGKKRRNSVKPVLLGIMYGRGASSIAEQMGISKKEAEQTIKDFFANFPKVAEFVMNAQQSAMELGYVETACGRKRRLPDMQLEPYEITPLQTAKSANFNPLFDDDEEDEDIDPMYVPDEIYDKYYTLMEKAWGNAQKQKVKAQAEAEGYKITDNGGKIADAERQCVNSIIQGSSADITKSAMLRIYHDELLRKYDFKLLLTVHDEVIGMCPKEHMQIVANRLSQVMIDAAKPIVSVPMKCDVEVTERWYGEVIEFEDE